MPAQQEGRKRDLERVNEHRKCLVRLDKPQLAPFTGKNPEKPWEWAQGRKVDVERPLLLASAAAGFLRSRENSGSGGFDTQFVGVNLPVPQARSSHPSSISQLKKANLIEESEKKKKITQLGSSTVSNLSWMLRVEDRRTLT